MKKVKKAAMIMICAALIPATLSGCRSSAYIRDDEAEEKITNGDCDDATWDYLCDAHERLIDAYATAVEKDDAGELIDTGEDKDKIFGESADYINDLMDASQKNYNADEARAIGDRINELISILEQMSGSAT